MCITLIRKAMKKIEVGNFVASVERDITKDGRIYKLGEWKEHKAIVIILRKEKGQENEQ